MSKFAIGITIFIVILVAFFFIGNQQVNTNMTLGVEGFTTFGEVGVTNSSSTVASSASGTAVVAANNGRIYLHLVNSGDYDAYLIFDTLNQTSESMFIGQGLLLAPDQHYEIGFNNLYQGGITGIVESTSTVISIIEK